MISRYRTQRSRRTMLPFSRARRAAQDLAIAQRKHLIHGMFEVDITLPRSLLEQYQQATGASLSFTAFIVGCVARAVDEQKSVQGYRKGRRHLVVFDDVDVNVLIERAVGGRTQVVYHIVRAANTKSTLAIHSEIRQAQAKLLTRLEHTRFRIYALLPRFVRRFGIWMAARNPDLWKIFGGTVAVAAVGMFAKGGGWGIPITGNTLVVTVGGIDEKPRVIDGQMVQRELLCLTVSVDHDVVDGAPAARFVSRLRELVESGYGLTQLVAEPVSEPTAEVAAVGAAG